MLVVTGGFRSREGVLKALEDGACDAVGIGRPAVKFPDLPEKVVFNDGLRDEEARFDVEPAPPVPSWITNRIRSVGAGAETVSAPLTPSYFLPLTRGRYQKYFASLMQNL